MSDAQPHTFDTRWVHQSKAELTSEEPVSCSARQGMWCQKDKILRCVENTRMMDILRQNDPIFRLGSLEEHRNTVCKLSPVCSMSRVAM